MKLKTFAFLYSFFFMLLLSVVLLVYREYGSLPQIKQALEAFQKRELSTLNLAFEEQINFLKTINYDYAVWTDSFEFMHEFDQTYLDDNYLQDTFVSLKIDGVILYDAEGSIVWHRGHDYTNGDAIDWPATTRELRTGTAVLPGISRDDKVQQASGFVGSRAGVITYAATEIRNSDRSGDTPGFLLFVRKIRPDLIQRVATISQMRIEASDVAPAHLNEALPLSALLGNESYRTSRIRYLQDDTGKPVLWMTIHHDITELPKLFDQRTLVSLAILTGIPFLFMLFVSTHLVKPIVDTENHIKLMVKSRKLIEIKRKFRISEVKDLVLHFNNLILRLKAYHASLEAMSVTDQLTGIPNRRAYEQFAFRAWNRMQRRKTPLAMILCDVDFFKKYNDSAGHAEGDRVLLAVAQALHNKINRADDLVARYGGEEFILVLENSSMDNLTAVCHLIHQAIENLAIPHPTSDTADRVTISVGAALFDDFSSIPLKENHEFLVRQADRALYQAKADGRNCCRIYQRSGQFLAL